VRRGGERIYPFYSQMAKVELEGVFSEVRRESSEHSSPIHRSVL
jgi:hypothetical protein